MDNKEKILHCALDLFYQKGYDAVGIQEICQASGITKPTLYHYFGSKAGLMEAVLERELTQILIELEQVAENTQGIEPALDQFSDVILGFATQNPKAYMLLMALSYSAKENEVYHMVKPYISKLYASTVRMFERSAGQLGNMNNRQNQFAIGFLGLLNHYVMFLAYKEETDSITEISKADKKRLIHQFMHGIWT